MMVTHVAFWIGFGPVFGWFLAGIILTFIQDYAREPNPFSSYSLSLFLKHIVFWPIALIKCRKWWRCGGHECFFTRHADMTKATEFWGPDRKREKVKR